MATKRQVYLKHIKRLEAQNRELVEMLLHERKLRINAYAWYQRRLRSWLWAMFDLITMHSTSYRKTKRP